MCSFDQKKVKRSVLKINGCPDNKHKIILSWPKWAMIHKQIGQTEILQMFDVLFLLNFSCT